MIIHQLIILDRYAENIHQYKDSQIKLFTNRTWGINMKEIANIEIRKISQSLKKVINSNLLFFIYIYIVSNRNNIGKYAIFENQGDIITTLKYIAKR